MKNLVVHGTYCDAVIYTVDDPVIAVDEYALAQVQMICDHCAMRGAVVRVMPDVHPGKVGPIGLTIQIVDRILPQLVGVDIGCGMSLVRLKRPKLEFQKLDSVIREAVPTGTRLHKTARADFDFDAMCCKAHIQREKALCSLGTLGGGNHFIELDRDENGDIYIIVHSGSRHLGKEVCDHYCREGQKYLKAHGITESYEMTWLEGQIMQDYLHDVDVARQFAALNREMILYAILKRMKWKLADDVISCSHNYIDRLSSQNIETAIDDKQDTNALVLRKGAVSALDGQNVIIPINMKDGVILGRGKGNIDWNCSAPHGAGRLYKREDVFKLFSVSAYKKSMEGIYSSCIGRATLDESPFCYRGLGDIQSAVIDTVDVAHILKPLYNYKDSSEN